MLTGANQYYDEELGKIDVQVYSKVVELQLIITI
jgi:hypothetical protein